MRNVRNGKWHIHKWHGKWWVENRTTCSMHNTYEDARKYFIARTKPAQTAAAYFKRTR